ncbi:MAG: hypothetical protein IJM35_03145 [Bacteroidales bacterium]|nr:hypothetical protein [Bacteroidales bacterium]
MKTKLYLFAILTVATIMSACKNEIVETIQTLPAPEVRTEGNSVCWNAVEGAINYLPEINGEEKNRIAELSLDLSRLGPGQYAVRIKAIGDGKKNGDSEWSNSVSHTVQGILAAPVLSVNGKKITWAAIENASSYEYSVNNADPVTTTVCEIDFTESTEGLYTVTVRAISSDELYTNSAWSEEANLIIESRLDTPVLSVSLATFAQALEGAGSSVSWEAISHANNYEVTIDGIPAAFSGTTIDLSSYPGSHTLSVVAVNTEKPSVYSPSQAATIELTVKSYGSGSESSPYLLYDKDDWNDFAELVASSNSFTDKYVALANDINFAGADAKTAGVSSAKKFCGVFDGKGHGISNFVISSTAANAGLFSFNTGTIKNLSISGGSVSSSIAGLARIALVSAGQSGGTYEGLTISNCSVSATDAAASYGGVIMAHTSVNASVTGCIVNNCNLTIGKDMGGYVVGVVGSNATLDISNCSVTGGVITARQYTGGILGLATTDAGDVNISNCVVKNATVNATANCAGGIAGQLNKGKIINSISNGNTIVCNSGSTTGTGKYAGGIAGQAGVNGIILNNLSKNCIVKSQNSVTDQLVALVIGGDIANATGGQCNNNVVASGSIYYGSAATKYVGIISGARSTNTFYSFNYYNAALQTGANKTDPSVELRAIGKAGIAGVSDLGGTVQITADREGLANLLVLLNDNIDTKLTAFPLAKKWIAGTDGWPTFDFE